jgi:hypothetical protein
VEISAWGVLIKISVEKREERQKNNAHPVGIRMGASPLRGKYPARLAPPLEWDATWKALVCSKCLSL